MNLYKALDELEAIEAKNPVRAPAMAERVLALKPTESTEADFTDCPLAKKYPRRY